FFDATQLEEMVNVGTLFAFVLVSAGVIVLRKQRPDLPRGFRVPWVAVLPLVAVRVSLWLRLHLTVLTWLRVPAWRARGVLIDFAASKRHAVLGRSQASGPESGPESEPTRTGD